MAHSSRALCFGAFLALFALTCFSKEWEPIRPSVFGPDAQDVAEAMLNTAKSLAQQVGSRREGMRFGITQVTKNEELVSDHRMQVTYGVHGYQLIEDAIQNSFYLEVVEDITKTRSTDAGLQFTSSYVPLFAPTFKQPQGQALTSESLEIAELLLNNLADIAYLQQEESTVMLREINQFDISDPLKPDEQLHNFEFNGKRLFSGPRSGPDFQLLISRHISDYGFGVSKSYETYVEEPYEPIIAVHVEGMR